MTYDELKEVCKMCPERDKRDNLWFMSWWSYCQSTCGKLKKTKKDEGLKKNFEK